MKVILLENLPKVGKKYEIVTVADGFALNYLIPQKKAEFASPEAVARIQNMEEKIAHERAQADEVLAAKLDEFKGAQVTFALPANEEGTLFAALSPTEILEALNGQFGAEYTLDQTNFTAIKEVGETDFEVVVGDKKGTIQVNVTPEEESEKKKK